MPLAEFSLSIQSLKLSRPHGTIYHEVTLAEIQSVTLHEISNTIECFFSFVYLCNLLLPVGNGFHIFSYQHLRCRRVSRDIEQKKLFRAILYTLVAGLKLPV